MTPELALVGYLPRDLLLSENFVAQSWLHVERLARQLSEGPPTLVGLPEPNPSDEGRPLFNSAALLRHHFIRLGFLPAWKQVVPERQREAVFMALQQALDAEALRRGGLCLTIPAAGIVARRTRNLDD